MVCVVGVRFKKAGKVYYFDPAEFPIAVGSKVVVETARGVEYGEVAVGPKDVTEDQVVQPLKKVIRPGNEKDALVAAENKRKEKEAFAAAAKKIQGHSLDMNLVDVEFTFDGSKIIFYFTAEGRVDFRDLVRDLAGVFRTRIEMRQIGVRDEAKLLGGIGPCGRILCCTSFLGDFAPVSIRMAKDQNLSLNPSKISGLCGRLMCCLRYEQDTYEAAKKDPTLAPGYVPPAMATEAAEELDDLEEERPRPRIGVRGTGESNMSARIAARAAALPERGPETERAKPQISQGAPRRDQGPRPQGGERQPQPQERRGPQPARGQQGRVPQQQHQAQPSEAQQTQGQQHRKGNQPQTQGQRPPVVERPRDEKQQQGGARPQNRQRHHRGNRPRGGDQPQRGPNPQE